MVLVQSIMDQTNSRLAPQIGHGLRTKTSKIQPAPDGLPILLRKGHGLSIKSKWIKLAPGRLLDRFLGSNVRVTVRSIVMYYDNDKNCTFNIADNLFSSAPQKLCHVT